MSEQCPKKQKPSGWTLAWSCKWQHEKLIQLSYTYNYTLHYDVHTRIATNAFTNSNKYIATRLTETTSNRKVDQSSSNSIKFDYPEGGICNFSYRYCWANT